MTRENLDSSPDQNDVIPTSSDKFLELVKATVDFGDAFRTSERLREQIVRLVVFGRNEQASETIQSNSPLNAIEAQELVEQIGKAADHVFYLTGLRP